MIKASVIVGVLMAGLLAAGFAIAQTSTPKTPPPKSAPVKSAPPKATPPKTTVQKAPAAAPAWTVDARASRVSVSEDTTGLAFSFDRWSAELRFDPANLAGSSAVVTLQMASVRTGDSSNDSTLRNDWVRAGQHPTATFRASQFRSLGGANYEAPGQLTIQGRTYPVVFRFSAQITGNQATVTGATQLDRAAMGFTVDPQFDWVSRMVTVNVSLRATKLG
jgi:polyisoprenoid-binding protein YceI